MKKLIFVLALILTTTVVFGQATPSGQLRVAQDTTQFKQNIPIGTTLFVVSDSIYYVAIAPVARTYTRATSEAKWLRIGGGGGSYSQTDTTGYYSAFHIVQEFDESTTHEHGNTHVLVGVAIPNSVLISLNGMELKKSEYGLTSAPGDPAPSSGVGTFYIKVPVYQYDRVKILYAYRNPNKTD
jgi:hypothetical protein